MTISELKYLLVIAFLCAALPCMGQFLTVTEITVEGNKRTKEHIILRELEFKVGDRIQQSRLAHVLSENKHNLLATGSFTYAELNVSDWDVDSRLIKIKILVRESPFLVPIPIFELADRNFNVWWNEFNASFSRVNYGLKLAILNAWGYGERIKISAQFGYTPKFNISALLPFIDNNQTVRMELSALYSVNKEVALFNEDNKQVFVQLDENIIFKRQEYRMGLIVRPKIFATHIFRLGYANNWIDPRLADEQNPDFFLQRKSRQEYIFTEYDFNYDKRDLPVMPTRGWRVGLNFKKEGFGLFDDVSATYFETSGDYYLPIGKRLVLGTELRMKLALEREKQPYYNYRGLGYGNNYLRGYELFVVDGLDFYYGKVSMGVLVLDKMIGLPKWFPLKSMRIMPLRVFIATNYDFGYVNDPYYNKDNSFTNSWLNGGGLGLNVLFYNTLQFQVEYSVNHLGQKGVFLHSNTAF